MKEVLATLGDIKVELAKLGTLQEIVSKMNGTLYGNGQEGVTTEVKSLKDWALVSRWLTGFLFAGIIGSLFKK